MYCTLLAEQRAKFNSIILLCSILVWQGKTKNLWLMQYSGMFKITAIHNPMNTLTLVIHQFGCTATVKGLVCLTELCFHGLSNFKSLC